MKMKKIFFITGLFIILLLTACASETAKELVEYHNSYLNNVNSKGQELDKIIKKSLNTSTPTEAYQLQKEKAMPIVKEVEEYINSQDPKTDIVKELHQMRLEQFKLWHEGIQLKFQAVKKMGNQSVSQQETKDIIEESNRILKDAMELGKKADNKFLELADEHGLELEE
ncbi:hypothetical protein SAMN05216232_1439 [Virgibacillus subterraneus]|uniref:Lipoprotein n=1 Tax=Virgibacillus subterraneus TaxID=621109 RepID=A0A1H9C2R9_9BACI|nr:hypothetical protein [Virgibacillus subterraneus]SEP95520.1 hypothetical protein SAMN05216232_1439 [Virgibacillus subterraneus]